MKTRGSRLIICSALVLSFSIIYAQKERNVWCFGDSAVVDFNSGAPLSSGNCSLNQQEGCASIADRRTGQLLFYTDGMVVFDRNNDTMKGQSWPLGGNWSSTQSALIVPMPGNPSKYYIFCTDAEAGTVYLNGGGNWGAQYCIIDMNLNGGLGGIAHQSAQLLTPTCEKIAAVTMAGNQGYWILVHLWDSNTFYVYPLTTAGIGTPVISNIGVVVHPVTGILGGPDNEEAIGYMRISPDGNKLAVVTRYILNTLEIFNFNDTTGIISGPFFTEVAQYEEPSTVTTGPYGVCFSPNSKLLYYTIPEDTNIYQLNLLAGNLQSIKASKKAVGRGQNRYAMQIGPDQRIYVAIYDSAFVDCINFPDSAGLTCGYRSNAVALHHAFCRLGLPEFAINLTECEPGTVNIEANKLHICANDSVNICAPTGFSSYQWNTANTSGCIEISQAGNYYVTVTDYNGCTTESNHLTINITQSPEITTTARGDTLQAFGAVTYHWYLNGGAITGATDSVFIASQPGSYTLQITDSNGCSAISNAVIITGIEQLSEQSVAIFPNPTNDAWQLIVDSKLLGSNLEVLDNNGRVVFQSQIANLKTELSSNISSGVYLLRISSGSNTFMKKLIKL